MREWGIQQAAALAAAAWAAVSGTPETDIETLRIVESRMV